MEEEKKLETIEKRDYFLPLCILLSALVLAGAWIYTDGLRAFKSGDLTASLSQNISDSDLEELVLPADGVVLPVVWGDLGKRLVESGVIDSSKIEEIYAARGGLDEEAKQLLYGTENGKLKITPQNSNYVLNLLWALGLANKNEILEKGPMSDPEYGGAGGFASTGGWVIAKGDAMDYYSKFSFVKLTPAQQQMVERVSKGIYRPCCNNSTYFPDCNHGMAMFGLLELMAAQGVSEADMYKFALKVNSYWFSDTYLTIAKYMQAKGIGWNAVDPKNVLGANFSSGSGYRKILSEVTPVEKQSGGGCGI